LSNWGERLGEPYAKKIKNTPLWELRIAVARKAHRIFYIAWTGKRFILLHAFTKKQQKTPAKEIKVALQRFELIKETEK
jgi:phage-related protein